MLLWRQVSPSKLLVLIGIDSAFAFAREAKACRRRSSMSVLENLLVAQHNELMVASGYSIFGLLNLKRYKDKEIEAVEKAKTV